jgi:hypothetical protein
VDVKVVDRAGANAHEHPAGTQHRVGRLFMDENVGTAVLVQPDGAHRRG